MPSPVIYARNRLGVAVRAGDPEAEARARRELAVTKVREYAKRVLADVPLTDADREELRGVIA